MKSSESGKRLLREYHMYKDAGNGCERGLRRRTVGDGMNRSVRRVRHIWVRRDAVGDLEQSRIERLIGDGKK